MGRSLVGVRGWHDGGDALNEKLRSVGGGPLTSARRSMSIAA